MERKIILLALISTIFLACSLSSSPQDVSVDVQQATPSPNIITRTPVIPSSPSATPSPRADANTQVPAPTPVGPTRTYTPFPTDTSPDSLQERLAERVASPAWDSLGLSSERETLWQNFASGQEGLDDDELLSLEIFLSQWERLEAMAENVLIPQDARLSFRVAESTGSQGEIEVLTYAIDPTADLEEGAERLYLIAHDDAGQGVGLVLAPQLDSLSQQISRDGEFVEYVDQKGVPLLLVDALVFDLDTPHQKRLNKALEYLYGWSGHKTSDIYPRFRYVKPGVDASFYAIDINLTYNQILLLRETLDLFDRPGFKAFKPAIFHDDIAYIFFESIDIASGVTFNGTGVVGIDRRDLFGNKYALASVLAHEGAHVLQGVIEERTSCEQVLRLEVGDHTIPPDFYEWSAEELLKAVEDLQVGAYHVSLWVLNELGLGQPQWIKDVIRTGMLNGQSVVLCSS